MRIVAPKKSSAEESVYFQIRFAKIELRREFASWIMNNHVGSIMSSGPYWYFLCCSKEEALLVRSWIDEHGISRVGE